jgi:hypothetical protein
MGKGINTQQPVVHVLQAKISYNTIGTTATGVKIGTIPAGSIKTRTSGVLITPFTTTSSTMSVGTAASAAAYAATSELPLLTASNFFNSTTGMGYIAADTDVYVYNTFGTTQLVGQAAFAVEFVPPMMNKQLDNSFDT